MPSEPLPDWIIQQRRQVGDRIRQTRMARGMSQERLGQAADLDRKTVSRIETGTGSPLLDHLLRIARALNVEPALLLTPLSPDETWPPPR